MLTDANYKDRDKIKKEKAEEKENSKAPNNKGVNSLDDLFRGSDGDSVKIRECDTGAPVGREIW